MWPVEIIFSVASEFWTKKKLIYFNLFVSNLAKTMKKTIDLYELCPKQQFQNNRCGQ